MTRLLAIFPLGFALFFTGTASEVWREVLHPKYPEMRLMAFGIAWMQTIGALLCWGLVVVIAFGALEPKRRKDSNNE